MRTRTVSQRSFVKLTEGSWYLGEIGKPTTVTLGKEGKQYNIVPFTIHASGSGIVPSEAEWFAMIADASPLELMFPANKGLLDALTELDPPCYVMARYLGKRVIKGGHKFNDWSITAIELDQSELDTLEGRARSNDDE